MPYTDHDVCTECGHTVSMHTDNGCIYRSAGTRELPPRICLCDRTGFELRNWPDLRRAAESEGDAESSKSNGTNGFEE